MRTASEGSSKSPQPRVCLALRWRESRKTSDVSSPKASPSLEDGRAAPPSGAARESRLCVLRRRATKRTTHAFSARPRHAENAEESEAPVLVGLGMRAHESTQRSNGSTPSASHFDVVVQTPLVSVEGLNFPTPAPSRSTSTESGVRGFQERQQQSSRQPPAQSSSSTRGSSSQHSDAELTQQLAQLIAAELRAPPLPESAVSSSLPVRRCMSVLPVDSREVLTFVVGPQGCGKTTFLLGGVQGGSSCSSPAPSASTARGSAVSGGVFYAVMERLFKTADRRGPLSVAVSVVEGRDAAPLRHPSILQRPRETVDLLSGQLLHLQDGEDGGAPATTKTIANAGTVSNSAESAGGSALSTSSVVDQPTDIPAACYVRVASPAEALQVLHAALSSSVSWRLSLSEEAADLESIPPHQPLPPLRPAGLVHEEKTSHVCVTVLVSDVRNGGDESHSPSPRSGGKDVEADFSSLDAPVGIWKLWDLAGPSPACGYEPYDPPAEARQADGGPQRSLHSHNTASAEYSAEEVLQMPWHNRYSLASLTHTCLTHLTRYQEQPQEERRRSLCLLDATSAQIVASARESSTLVVPIFTVVAEAAMDDMNAEVLKGANAWADLSALQQPVQQSSAAATQRVTSTTVTRRHEKTEENAFAARCVLQRYAVALSDLMAERRVLTMQTGQRERSAAAAGSGRHDNFVDDAQARRSSPSTAQREVHDSTLLAVNHCEGPHAVIPPEAIHPMPSSSSAMQAGRASAAARADPLSIEVTAMEEDSTAMMLRRRGQTSGKVATPHPASSLHDGDVEGKPPLSKESTGIAEQQRGATPLRGKSVSEDLVHTPSHRLDLTGADGVPGVAQRERRTDNTVLRGKSIAQLCAEGAVDAEESRLRRFRHILETEFSPDSQDISVDAAEAETGVDNVEASAELDSAAHREAEAEGTNAIPNDVDTTEVIPELHVHQADAAPLRTPPRKAESPPSVMYTGVRLGLNADSNTTAAASSAADALSRHRVCREMSQLPTLPVDDEESPVCAPQTLQYDTPGLTNVQDGKGASTRLASEEAARREGAATSSDLPDAALVKYLAPYCEQFVTLYEEMRRDVQTWKAAEEASLRSLTTLAEQHSHDIEQLTQLMQTIATAQPTLHAPSRDPSYDGVVLSSLPDASAAFASTNSLIFEQLMRSEEKVTWLEKQLLQWRQRTHEASVLHSSMVGAELEGDEGEDESFALANQSRAGVEDSNNVVSEDQSDAIRADTANDPTRRYVRQAQRILQRLLLRCGRAYASAQQRSTRWHDQLVQEQTAKSALLERVTELERELAAYRQQGAGRMAAASFTSVHSARQQQEQPHARASRTLHVSTESADASTPLQQHLAPRTRLPDQHTEHRTLRSGVSDWHTVEGDSNGKAGETYDTNWKVYEQGDSYQNSGKGSAEWLDDAALLRSATPAPVSPIESLHDTALSLPSLSERRLRSPYPAGLQRSPLPAIGTGRDSPAASAVPAQLAALLSRAVQGTGGKGNRTPLESWTKSSGHGAGAAPLFDIHVAPSSAATASVTAVEDHPHDFSFHETNHQRMTIYANDSGSSGSGNDDEEKVGGRNMLGANVSVIASSLSPSTAPSAAPHVAFTQKRAAGGQGGSGDYSSWRTAPLARPSTYSQEEAYTRENDAETGRGGAEWQQPWSRRQDGGPPSSAAVAKQSVRVLSADAYDDNEGRRDVEAYPTDALQRLQQAAAQLAADAIRLTELSGRQGKVGRHTLTSAAEQLRNTLHPACEVRTPPRRGRSSCGGGDTDEADEERGADVEEGEETGSLFPSMAALRSASQAVHREAREAAEREKAYLSTILFSPNATP